eukprot:766955-Hanusia_phi.AAC.1
MPGTLSPVTWHGSDAVQGGRARPLTIHPPPPPILLSPSQPGSAPTVKPLSDGDRASLTKTLQYKVIVGCWPSSPRTGLLAAPGTR